MILEKGEIQFFTNIYFDFLVIQKVYILILPGFGLIFFLILQVKKGVNLSHLVSIGMIYAIGAIGILGFVV